MNEVFSRLRGTNDMEVVMTIWSISIKPRTILLPRGGAESNPSPSGCASPTAPARCILRTYYCRAARWLPVG